MCDVTTWLANNCNTYISKISQNKGNQTMKFGQLVEYNKINIFLQKSCKNETGRLVPDHFLFLKKALYEVKASDLQFQYILIVLWT